MDEPFADSTPAADTSSRIMVWSGYTARFRPGSERLVEALAAETGRLGDSLHPMRLGSVSDRIERAQGKAESRKAPERVVKRQRFSLLKAACSVRVGRGLP
jgi:hypothetical protein